MSVLRTLGVVAATALLMTMYASAQPPPGPPPLRPSTFATAPGEVWTEAGLRAVDSALRVESTGGQSRVRLVTRRQRADQRRRVDLPGDE